LYRACRAEGIKPILGIEFRQDNEFLYLGIARNDEGWRELCSLLTESSLTGEPLAKEAPELQHCYIIYRKLPKGVELLQ
jgi:DNA polymerase III alpha subunit